MGQRKTVLSSEQISVICYQISLMQSVGIGLEESFDALLKDTSLGHEHALLSSITTELERGERLSTTLQNCAVFPDYMVKMIGRSFNGTFYLLSTRERKGTRRAPCNCLSRSDVSPHCSHIFGACFRGIACF